MKLKWIAAGIVLAGALSSQADAILWDINETSGTANDGAVSNFVELGVTEDLTGAVVSQVTAITDSSMTDGTLTLSYISGIAQSATSYTTNNVVLADYLYLSLGGNEGPVTMQISGLNGVLDPNTTYSLYLIGAGNNTDQGAQFEFESVTLSTVSLATVPEAAAKFSFTTDGSVDDTLQFTWSRIGSNQYSAFNGFAIVAVPEPATIGLIGISGGLMLLYRRIAALRKSAA